VDAHFEISRLLVAGQPSPLPVPTYEIKPFGEPSRDPTIFVQRAEVISLVTPGGDYAKGWVITRQEALHSQVMKPSSVVLV
jgi:hypothetical protein